jgi:hypothetical protein
MISSYNHNTLGTAAKPLIPNLEFKLLHLSLQHGEIDFYEECMNKYSLESRQKSIVEPLYNKLKK